MQGENLFRVRSTWYRNHQERANLEKQIAAYLPFNYGVVGSFMNGDVLVAGADKFGWDANYVMDRLASGCYTVIRWGEKSV